MNAQHGVAGADNAGLKVVAGGNADPTSQVSDGPRIVDLPDAEQSQALLSLILKQLDDDKAEDIAAIDLAGKSDIADHMVIASGRSQRHVGAMADKITREIKAQGLGGAKVEGATACDWVLIDAGDVIVHLFRPEVREFYNLERVWSETAHASTKKVDA